MSKDLATLKQRNQKQFFDLKGLTSLKEENFSLKRKLNSLTKDVENFVQGRENLDLILVVQKYSLHKGGFGYSYSNCQKYYKNFFVEAFSSSKNPMHCNYYGIKGHISSLCYKKKNNLKKGKYVWIQKGTKKPYSNEISQKGPNMIWVPKKSNSYVVGMS